MNKVFAENEVFNGIDYNDNPCAFTDFENCTFINCIFTSVNLKNISFAECTFETCDLSNAKISNTSFKDIKFNNCKLMGLHFEQANDFLFFVDFDSCQLSFTSFYKCVLKSTRFRNCNLQEVDFTEADLSISHFDNCDLSGAHFENTNLQKADFRSAFNFTIDPELNRIKKAKFSRLDLEGLLHKYDIVID